MTLFQQLVSETAQALNCTYPMALTRSVHGHIKEIDQGDDLARQIENYWSDAASDKQSIMNKVQFSHQVFLPNALARLSARVNMSASSIKSSSRTPEQIRQHYEVEKELAEKLRLASKQERRLLYAQLYDELFRRVPDHPQLTKKATPQNTAQQIHNQMHLLKSFLKPHVTFLELGSGDCALSFAAAQSVKSVYAVDVSEEVTRSAAAPPNFTLILSDGCSIPVPPGSVHVAYSNQLMEHLHPDDALEQLQNIFTALTPGGVYICLTPNSLTGPHDISKHFDETATGFHMKEYTVTDLSALFRQVGFSTVRAFVGGKGTYLNIPVLPITLLENFLSLLPPRPRKFWARLFPLKLLLLNARVMGIK